MSEIPTSCSENTNFYNLEAVIAVGFRTNSERAIVFRQWATSVLKDFPIRGYVMDKERLKNGTFLNEDYFDHLLEEITKAFPESEFEKYRIVQDRLFESDFDRLLKEIIIMIAELKDRNRVMILMLIEKIKLTGNARFIPLLKVWKE
ncbi:MAG: RhuM family protein, partial [Eubacteriales bacterium]